MIKSTITNRIDSHFQLHRWQDFRVGCWFGLTILLICTFRTHGGTHSLYKNYFINGHDGEIVYGNWEMTKIGLRGDKDSRIRFTVPNGYPARNCDITFSFIPPKIGGSSVPFNPIGDDCICAIKVSIGRIVVELSDRWVRIARLNKEFSHVDSIIATKDRIMPEGPPREVFLGLHIEDRLLTISLNKQNVLSAPINTHNLSTVAIGTYRKPFTLTSLLVSAISKDTLSIDTVNKYIEVAAVFHPSHFNSGDGLQNHHFIVWNNGKASEAALFKTYVSDSTIHDALLAIGATPGNNLTMKTWEKRTAPKSKEPDKHVKGSPVEVTVIFNGKHIPADAVIHDANNKPMDLRFGGNREYIPIWGSGCVVCLQSCPGGKIGNRTYTIRDLMKGIPQFTVNQKLPFQDGDDVILRFSYPKQQK